MHLKKDSRPRQGEDKHEKDVPGHLKLALTVFAFIMMISVVLAFAFKWLGLVNDVLLMVIIISTISLGVVVPTLKEMNIMRTTIGLIYFTSSCISRFIYHDFTNCLWCYLW